MIQHDVREKLERFEASVENRTADGSLLEELVEQCAPDVADWELSDCWALRDYPRLSEFGLEPYDDGIDLIAEKTDGRSVAIQCKALSDSNVTTTMIQKFAGKANKFDERWLVTTAQQTSGNARTLQECNVLWKDALAELPHAFLGGPRRAEIPRIRGRPCRMRLSPSASGASSIRRPSCWPNGAMTVRAFRTCPSALGGPS